MSDNLYYSVLVTRRLLCNCSAYKYPHSVSSSQCCSILPVDFDSVPVKISHTARKRASDIILKDKFF